MRSGRLNSFQKTMLQWNDMHPYNAVHVVRIPAVLNAEELRRSLHFVLQQRGLTNLVVDRRKNCFAYLGGEASCDFKLITGEADAVAAVQTEVERQLNMPFRVTDKINPFRFFVVISGEGILLGLAYFHPVADAESIVLLLRDLVRAYVTNTGADSSTELNLYPDHRAHLLLRHPAVVAGKLMMLPAQARSMKRSHRPRYHDAQDGSIGFRLFSLSPERLRYLLAAAKSWEVTVNDLLLALLMKSVSPLAASRVKAAKRNKLSAGCIVNLRHELVIDSARTFGLFLGSFTVTHAMPDGSTLREVAGDVRRQTLAIKQKQLYLATPMELALGRFVLRFFSPDRRKKFYQKNYPLWGGLTNMNLNTLWGHSNDDSVMDYFRGVSTGPVTPLVFSVTTFGDHANIGLSYRRTVFSPEDIEGVKCNFLEQLDKLAEVG